jgi:hypothetical protein
MITFSRSHANAYRVWKRTPTGGKKIIGTVAKLDGVWKYQKGCVIYEGSTRMEAINKAFATAQ